MTLPTAGQSEVHVSDHSQKWAIIINVTITGLQELEPKGAVGGLSNISSPNDILKTTFQIIFFN